MTTAIPAPTIDKPGVTFDSEHRSSRTVGMCGPERRPTISVIPLVKLRAREEGILQCGVKIDLPQK
jgi:hypothetical protein